MDDLMRFMREDEAIKAMSLFEGASESQKISKSSLKNWVVSTRHQISFLQKFNEKKKFHSLYIKG